jgi:hypothetical protein
LEVNHQYIRTNITRKNYHHAHTQQKQFSVHFFTVWYVI